MSDAQVRTLSDPIAPEARSENALFYFRRGSEETAKVLKDGRHQLRVTIGQPLRPVVCEFLSRAPFQATFPDFVVKVPTGSTLQLGAHVEMAELCQVDDNDPVLSVAGEYHVFPRNTSTVQRSRDTRQSTIEDAFRRRSSEHRRLAGPGAAGDLMPRQPSDGSTADLAALDSGPQTMTASSEASGGGAVAGVATSQATTANIQRALAAIFLADEAALDQVADVGLVVFPMWEEYASFGRVATQLLWTESNNPADPLPLWTNAKGRQLAALVVERMGNTEAQRRTTTYLRLLKPKFAVLIGIAGGLNKVKLGTVVVPVSVTKWDMSSMGDSTDDTLSAEDQAAEAAARRQLTEALARVNAIVRARRTAAVVVAMEVERREGHLQITRVVRDRLTRINQHIVGQQLLEASPLPVPTGTSDDDKILQGILPTKPSHMIAAMDGVVAAGDSVVKSQVVRDFVLDTTGGLGRAVAMEDFGFAAACEDAEVPFGILRGVSDIPRHKNLLNRKERQMPRSFRNWAGENAAAYFLNAFPFLDERALST